MKPALRSPLLAFHTWAGFTAGLVLLVVALSGAALIFRTPIERRLDPKLFVVDPGPSKISLDILVEHARSAHPTSDVEKIWLPGDPTAPTLVLFSDGQHVHLNPYTGTVLGLRARYGDGFGWSDGLHRFLIFDQPTGRVVTGSFAFGFFALALGGLTLWWPTTHRALKSAFTLDRTLTGRAWKLNLHRTFGAAVALVILFNAATGATIAFEPLRNVFYFLTGSTKDAPPAPQNQPPGKFVGYEAINRRITTLLPGAREIYLVPPKRGLVLSGIVAADAPNPNARSYVWLDSTTAEIVRYTPNAQTSAGFRLYSWLFSLHTSVTGGLLVKLVLLFTCLSVPVLAYTGVASFLRRNSKRAVSPAPALPASPDVAPQRN